MFIFKLAFRRTKTKLQLIDKNRLLNEFLILTTEYIGTCFGPNSHCRPILYAWAKLFYNFFLILGFFNHSDDSSVNISIRRVIKSL
ncbi:High osmolarity signaling protein SHO1 [Bienertia sinuspersici]